MNLTLSSEQGHSAAVLQSSLHQFALSSNVSLQEFFATYAHFNGSWFRAAWNASQTLSWHREPGGVRDLGNVLQSLSSEVWTFPGADAPFDCPLASDFNPKLAVSTTNCFYATSTLPSDAEVKSRYALSLSADKLANLTEEFRKARAAALALGIVSAASTGNVADEVQVAWTKSQQQLGTAFGIANRDVVTPLLRASADIEAVAESINCTAAYHSLVRASNSFGVELVDELLALHAVFWTLACSSLGFAVLFCLLWAMRQPGNKTQEVRDSRSDEGYDSADNEEVELQHLLKRNPGTP